MSSSGTLVAYSTPANVRHIKEQAALISLAIREYSSVNGSRAIGTSRLCGDVRAFTIETENQNVHLDLIEDDLYLVLVGPSGPSCSRPKFHFQIYGARQGDPQGQRSASEKADALRDNSTAVIDMQRRKADNLALFVRQKIKEVQSG